MFRRKAVGAGLAGLVGLAGAVAMASPAQAYVYNCGVSWPNSYTVQGYCAGGTGTFRLLVDCANVHGVSTIGSDWVYRHESDEVIWIYTQGVGCGTGYITNPRVDAR